MHSDKHGGFGAGRDQGRASGAAAQALLRPAPALPRTEEDVGAGFCVRAFSSRLRLATLALLAAGLCPTMPAADESKTPPPNSEHFLLFAAEGMQKIVVLGRDGSLRWEYPAQMSRDAWRLPNGNILFCYNNEYDSGRHDNPSGVMEVTPDKKIVFHFRTTGQVWSCQRMSDGHTLVGAASQGKLLIVNAEGTLVRSIKLVGTPGHSCLRNARQIEGGHFLVAEEGSHAVREYSAGGSLLREIKVDFPPYSAVRLANGNTLACGQGKMSEFDSRGESVWSVRADDFPQLGIRWFAGIQVLTDGNILVCNAGGKVPIFELNRAKQIPWQWPSTAAALSLGHGIQRLDIAGSPLK